MKVPPFEKVQEPAETSRRAGTSPARADFHGFCQSEIAPFAAQSDREQRLPWDLVKKVAAQGYLASFLNSEWGGRGFDEITYGVLHEEVGRACSSIRSLLTVHDMVVTSLLRWGNHSQRRRWLPRLASGQTMGAFAVTEPEAGSDLRSIRTEAIRTPGGYVLNGIKKWVSFGQLAGVFLLLARFDGKLTAFLVERDTPGLTIHAINGMLGVRASMLAELEIRNCTIAADNVVGRPGLGLETVISTALGLGRYSVAWGCVGIAQACLDTGPPYTASREQYGKPLRDHQLIRRMISDMVVGTKAARLLCCRAGTLKSKGDPGEVMETMIAKYFASKAAMQCASDAVQIHGANGCSDEYPVERYFRDAKIMEIIEGSTQLQQILIADYGFQQAAVDPVELPLAWNAHSV